MGKVKVGDKVTLEARVRRVDDATFTIQIGHLTPITLPHDHEAAISVTTDKAPPKPPQASRQAHSGGRPPDCWGEIRRH